MSINLIACSGYIGSGKDTVGHIIRWITSECYPGNGKHNRTFSEFMEKGQGNNDFQTWYNSEWEIRKFAGKLKQIASLMTGIPVEKFEDQEFKKTFMGPEWDTLIEKAHLDASGRLMGAIKEPVRMTVREFLQRLGTEAVRNGLHPNAWVNATFADYQPNKPWTGGNKATLLTKGQIVPQEQLGNYKYPKWILTDCRFPNEAQAIKDRGGIVVRVNRPGDKPEYETLEEYTTRKSNRHPSEISLDDWKFDWVINNDGSIEDLILKVKLMLQHFGILTPEVVNN